MITNIYGSKIKGFNRFTFVVGHPMYFSKELGHQLNLVHLNLEILRELVAEKIFAGEATARDWGTVGGATKVV